MEETASENEKLISYVSEIAGLTKDHNIIEKRFFDFIKYFPDIGDKKGSRLLLIESTLRISTHTLTITNP